MSDSPGDLLGAFKDKIFHDLVAAARLVKCLELGEAKEVLVERVRTNSNDVFFPI